MNIFITGATGWVGSAVVQDMISSGHQVTGLARSDVKAATLAATGATVIRASLDDLAVLRDAASKADAVIHTAFNHDFFNQEFSRFMESCEQDRRVIEAMGSALQGEGQNRWAGVHRQDAARVFRLALEQGVTESVYHAVADEAVSFKDIAEVIGRRLGLPVESRERDHFGWFANFAGAEMSASSSRTRQLLGWTPAGPALLADLDQAGYYAG